ncbi:transglutaminase-like cysteine peptidase [Alsobacter sp. R-9]
MHASSLAALLAAAFAALMPRAVGEPAMTAGVEPPGRPAIVLANLGDRSTGLPPSSAPMAPGGIARPITGWLKFCKIYVDECRVDPAESDTIRLTPAVWALINEVNTSVNTAIRPVTDVDHWNELDRWDLAEDGRGDCEDYQLLKRRKLAMLGLPRRAMVMTVVLDERNEGHAVLTLRTDRGDLILDNKRNDVLAWHKTGYVFVKRESQADSSWVNLNHVSGVGTTAAR